MNLITYLSTISIPIIILIILLSGLLEKKEVFNIFSKGAKEGFFTVYKIAPTLIGLFLAIGALRSSGIIDFLANILGAVLGIFRIPKEILPLILLRPISGGGSIAIASDIMSKFGVDSYLGLVAATIVGSTETTLYAIAVYTSSIDVKKTRFVLFAALLADFAGILASIFIWKLLI